MITHYFKVAFRNLWKYKTQNLISILGLAAGFVCFALSSLWLRYELTYDHFHEEAERIFAVHDKGYGMDVESSSRTPDPMAAYLVKEYPEVETACHLYKHKSTMSTPEGIVQKTDYLEIDSAFLKMFGVRILEGTSEFTWFNTEKAALTQQAARQLFPHTSPIGKTILSNSCSLEVCAVVTGWGKHSNLPYDMLTGFSIPENGWEVASKETYLKLNPKVDIRNAMERIETTFQREGFSSQIKPWLIPLKAKRSINPDRGMEMNVQLKHLRLFATTGLLLIGCALLNYFGIFISQLRIRSREMALRLACGSSYWQLWKLLCTELCILLGAALCVGIVGIELVFPSFTELAQITESKGTVYAESVLYIALVIICSLLFTLPFLSFFRRNALRVFLNAGSGSKDYFRRICVGIQLVITLGFTFCTATMVKQIHHLMHMDAGLERENRATIWFFPRKGADLKPLVHQIQQLPQVIRVLEDGYSLLPEVFWRVPHSFLTSGVGKPGDAVNCWIIPSTNEMLDFYGIKVCKGRMPDFENESIHKEALINETLARKLEIDNPEEEKNHLEGIVIAGIVPDIQSQRPTAIPEPMLFASSKHVGEGQVKQILLEYQGNWAVCKKAITQLIKESPDANLMEIKGAEEAYLNYLKSEWSLLRLLSVVSAVCILVTLFGVYSLTALSCEQRRKEIAIRKVNGALVSDILKLFFREYLCLLCVASVLSFSTGYLLMKPWLENYTRQTELNGWHYLLIFLAVGIVLVATVFSRVWRATRRNPAAEIRNE